MLTQAAPVRTFSAGGGLLGEIIDDYDWSATTLGPIDGWPDVVRTTVELILRSPVPIVTLWGEDGIMLYNDAYSKFAGRRHPQLLGSKVREGWPEVADFNDNVMKVGLAGGTLSYRDQELTLHRSGRPEQVWMNLDYSPVTDESGQESRVMAADAAGVRRQTGILRGGDEPALPYPAIRRRRHTYRRGTVHGRPNSWLKLSG